MKSLSSFAVLLIAGGTLAANPVFNGSFELGTDGFALEKELRTDTNPGLKFIPLKVTDKIPGSGKRSLLFENPYAEYYNIFSKEFRLKPSTEYKLSVKLKSSKGNDSVYFGVFKVDPQWSAHSRTFTVPTAWKEFEFTFTTAPKSGWYHILIRPGDRDAAQDSSLFFDDLKITETGKPETVFAEAVAVPDKTLYLRGEEAEIQLKITNPDFKPFSGNVTVSGREEYGGKPVFSERISVKLAAGEIRTIPLGKQKLTRYAGIRLTVSGSRLKTHDSFFSVIGKYDAKPFDIGSKYVVAFNGSLDYRMPPQTKTPSYLVYNAPLEKRFELLAQAGCRILRDHDGGVRGVNWPAVEWERGKFDFSHLDRQLALYEKYNIVLFPVIGDGFIENFQPWQNQRWPLWVLPLSERVKDDPPNCMNGVRGHILLPPPELYRNYIARTVRHIKGRVPVYEIMNEPNLYLAPETYVRYLKEAHDAIRSADPAAKISGFCLTSDFGAAATPWMQACVKAGGLNYVDAVGFHPYGGRELGAIRAADHYIADLRKEMRSYGKADMPLWNTELYYLIDQQVKHNSYEENLCGPHHAVWRFLVDLGEGVVQSISIPSEFLWKKMLTPNMQTGKNYHELIPSELFVAYNTMARLFEGAENVRKFRYPNGVICYVFRKDGKLIAAVWNYQKKKGVYGDLSAFNVMDLFGNAEKSGEKLLGDAPFYLTPRNSSDTEFLRQLKELKFRLDRPVSAGHIARLVDGTMYVMLHNDSGKEQAGVAGISGGGLTAVDFVRFTLPANGRLSLAIPVKTTVPDGSPATLMLYLNGTTFRLPLEIVRNKAVGRTFSMRNADGKIEFGNGKIHLSMTVRDATDAGASGKRSPWETDCVELFFDTDPLEIPPRHAQAYTSRTFRLFVTPRDVKKLHTMGNIKAEDCRIKLKQTGREYSFTLEIPVKTGNVLGFDVKIDDAGDGKMQETVLGNSSKLHLKRCNFSIVK